MTGASYDLPGTRGVIDNKTGNANAGFPSPISANSTNDYASATNVRVYDTNYDINVAWRITADSGTATREHPNPKQQTRSSKKLNTQRPKEQTNQRNRTTQLINAQHKSKKRPKRKKHQIQH
jgi:hypothetical protein